MENEAKIVQGHGSGGKLMHDLINNLFMKEFENHFLLQRGDATILNSLPGRIAFTTDSFVVDPIFFNGGDIGKLAVCGTINDLAAAGSIPIWLSASFIIEEGFPVADLAGIVRSMSQSARIAGVDIVCGDTKVVGKGQCDKIFITTSGIGILNHPVYEPPFLSSVQPGDQVIITGTIGDHGMAILAARNQLSLSSPLQSDCAPLNLLTVPLLENGIKIRTMRDPTRGGVASALCEITEKQNFGILLLEEAIPVKPQVVGMCELYGFDPLYIANEGKMLIIIAREDAHRTMDLLQSHELGKEAAIIGEITNDYKGQVLMRTRIGGSRIISMLSGEQLPRIC